MFWMSSRSCPISMSISDLSRSTCKQTRSGPRCQIHLSEHLGLVLLGGRLCCCCCCCLKAAQEQHAVLSVGWAGVPGSSRSGSGPAQATRCLPLPAAPQPSSPFCQEGDLSTCRTPPGLPAAGCTNEAQAYTSPALAPMWGPFVLYAAKGASCGTCTKHHMPTGRQGRA